MEKTNQQAYYLGGISNQRPLLLKSRCLTTIPLRLHSSWRHLIIWNENFPDMSGKAVDEWFVVWGLGVGICGIWTPNLCITRADVWSLNHWASPVAEIRCTHVLFKVCLNHQYFLPLTPWIFIFVQIQRQRVKRYLMSMVIHWEGSQWSYSMESKGDWEGNRVIQL